MSIGILHFRRQERERTALTLGYQELLIKRLRALHQFKPRASLLVAKELETEQDDCNYHNKPPG